MRSGHSSKWCLGVPVEEIDIAALKNVMQREANATVTVDEEDGELEQGPLDVSAHVYFIGRYPSLLRDNRAFSGPDVEVQWYRWVLSREPWRLWQHIRRVLRNVPNPAGVYYMVVLKKIRSSEQLREEAMDVLRREGICNETVNENVASHGGMLDGSAHVARDWMARVSIGGSDSTLRVHEA